MRMHHVKGHRRVQHLPASLSLLLRKHEQRGSACELEEASRLSARADDNGKVGDGLHADKFVA